MAKIYAMRGRCDAMQLVVPIVGAIAIALLGYYLVILMKGEKQ